MDTRQIIWQRAKLNPQVPLLIDPRMGGEFARIYSIRPCDPDQVDFYEQNLYPEEEAERLPCSAQSIIYCPTMIGGLIAFQVKSYAIGNLLAKEILFDLTRLGLVASPACRKLRAHAVVSSPT